MSIISAIINYNFMQNAVLTAIFSSILCAIIGITVIEKKLVMLTGGIAHTAYGGVGLGYLLGFSPILGATCFAGISAVIISAFNKKGGKLVDVLIATLWSLGMALGIIFVSLSSGYAPDMSSFLFGNILTVKTSEVILLIILTVLTLIISVVFKNYWTAYLFDEEFLLSKKVNVKIINTAVYVIVSLSVVMLIKITGVILILALITVPTATATEFGKKFNTRIVLSAIIGILYCFTGILASYYLNLPAGATIIVISAVVYFTVKIIKAVKNITKCKNK